MSNSKKRIFVVEDHPMVRERLAELVNKEDDMEVCGEADNVTTALELIQQLNPDIIIIDITLRGSSGLDLIRTLRKSPIETPILTLSMHDETAYAHRALRAGANGFIMKNQASKEIVSAVRYVLSGEIYLSKEMTSAVLRKFVPGKIQDAPIRTVDKLSNRELAVLEMLGRGNSSRIIAETLGVGIATVDTYRARIKEKLNLQNTFELQSFAIQWLREREIG